VSRHTTIVRPEGFDHNAQERVIRNMLDRKSISTLLTEWLAAWNRHDLEGVLKPMAENVLFEHWNGRVIRGKRFLSRAWQPWFAAHGDFRFEASSLCVDPTAQAFCFAWRLEWPSPESDFLGQRETREGVDLVQLLDQKILTKRSYIKTVLKIENRSILLKA
jgi:hypothetical protein